MHCGDDGHDIRLPLYTGVGLIHSLPVEELIKFQVLLLPTFIVILRLSYFLIILYLLCVFRRNEMA